MAYNTVSQCSIITVEIKASTVQYKVLIDLLVICSVISISVHFLISEIYLTWEKNLLRNFSVITQFNVHRSPVSTYLLKWKMLSIEIIGTSCYNVETIQGFSTYRKGTHMNLKTIAILFIVKPVIKTKKKIPIVIINKTMLAIEKTEPGKLRFSPNFQKSSVHCELKLFEVRCRTLQLNPLISKMLG